MEPLLFVIPLPPQRANARGAWQVHHRAKLAYWAHLDTIQLLRRADGFQIDPPPKAPFAKATASATLYLWNEMDQLNCGARLKFVEDWLVTRGYIVSDRMKALHWPSVPQQVITRTRPRVDRVELILEPLEAVQ